MSRLKLDALVEEATVDSNGEDEQVMGLYTMIADNLATPFQTTVLGVEVTVEDIDLTGQNTIVAHCPAARGQAEACPAPAAGLGRSAQTPPALPRPRRMVERYFDAFLYLANWGIASS